MAITRDSFNAGAEAGTTASISWTHTSVGSPDYAVVGIENQTGDNTSGVTWDGVSMTQLAKFQATLATPDGWFYIYGLASPADGAVTVVVSASPNSTLIASSTAYTGVKATGQPDASAGNETSSSPCVITMTTVADNSMLFAIGADGNYIIAGESGTTKITASAGRVSRAIFDKLTTTAGSNNIGFNGTSGEFYGVAVSLAPGSTAHTTTVSDSLSLSGTLSFIQGFVYTLSETLNLSDTVTLLSTFGHIISETFSLTDTITAETLIPVSISETMTISDTTTLVSTFGTIITETLNLNETVTTLNGLILSVTETITMSSTTTVGLTYVVAVTETITLVEDLFKQGWSWMQKNTGGVWTFLTKNTP